MQLYERKSNEVDLPCIYPDFKIKLSSEIFTDGKNEYDKVVFKLIYQNNWVILKCILPMTIDYFVSGRGKIIESLKRTLNSELYSKAKPVVKYFLRQISIYAVKNKLVKYK